MSRDPRKQPFYNRGRSGVQWGRSDFRSRGRPLTRKRSRSRSPPMGDKRRSGSPRKNDKDLIDENILSEISKLPEPSELWDSNQFQENANFTGSRQPPPQSQQQQPPPQSQQQQPQPQPPFHNEVVPYQPNYQPSYSGIYDDFPSVAPQNPMPAEMASWNQMSLPPPPAPVPFINNVEDQIKKEAAIESEMRHQRAALSKQREDYIKKAGILKKELDTLKDQRNELRGDAKRSPSPDTKRFLKENTKLQLEIQNKLKTINNVVDMLNGIIGEEAPELAHDSDDSERGSKRKSRSPSNKKFNYVYYDPEMHWCRVCNEFPPTAKDYLNHLHSVAHHKMAAAHMEAPWHSVSGINEGFPSYASAPTKRTPIKGLQFFVPSTAWYCKLCDQFIGDLHCASAHLKSVTHSKNYTNFVEQNPHWETDWMSDRQKAFEKARASNKNKAIEEKPQQYTAHTITFHKHGFHTKNTENPAPPPPDKKRKKEKRKKTKRKKSSSSSSSSSDSSSSDSDSDKKRKKSKSKKIKKIETEGKSLTEWMSSLQMDKLNENDRKLLNNLTSRYRMKPEKDSESKRRSQERATPSSTTDSRKARESTRRNASRSRSRSRRSARRSRGRESRARDPRRSPAARDDRHRSPAARDDRHRSPAADSKKPDVKKMPFIGKMPVYKSLGKKLEDQKKEEQEQKKKEDDEASKKRREEMDAEIQKKVAEFKEKIAKAQLDRQQQVADLPPPAIALPTQLGAAPPLMQPLMQPLAQPPPPAATPTPTPTPAPAPAPAPTPTLPKDFQEALDIIFPSDVKQELSQQELFLPSFPMPLGFPPLGLMQPQMPPGMFGFDMNAQLFQPRAQLYDAHVPLVPSPKPRAHKRPPHKPDKRQQHKQRPAPAPAQQRENGNVARKKEEMDELAMLGIDASDVGANI